MIFDVKVLQSLTLAMILILPGQAVAEQTATTAHDFSFVSIDESETIDLGRFSGKPVLIVNTASFCGFTPQYSGLEDLWQRYKERGLTVIGVPSNDFGGQEPNSEQEIQGFCQGAFNITFPLTRKYKVKGAGAHAFYQWLGKTTEGRGSPRWNFHKVLLSGDGQVAKWFASSVEPNALQVENAVEHELRRVAMPSKNPT